MYLPNGQKYSHASNFPYIFHIRPKKIICAFLITWSSKLGSVDQDFFFFFETYKYAPSSKITQTCFFLSFLLQLINYLTCSTMFSVPNIDQMYKEMKKIVDLVGNKHGNGDEFPDFADLFFYWHKKC